MARKNAAVPPAKTGRKSSKTAKTLAKPPRASKGEPESKVETKAKAKSEPKVKAKPEPKAKAKSEPKAKAKPEPKAKTKSEPKAKVKSEPKAKAKPEPKAKAKSEPKAKTKSEPKAKVKSEPKAKAKPEPKAKAKPEPKAKAKSEPQAKAEPKAKAKRGKAAAEATDASPAEALVVAEEGAPAEPKGRRANGARASRKKRGAGEAEVAAALEEVGAEPAAAATETAEAASGEVPAELAAEVEALADTSAFLKGLVEAILFVSDRPLTLKELARAAKIDKKRATELVAELQRDYQGRGLALSEVAGGLALRTSPMFASYIRSFLAQRPVRLSRPQLETLAIIAYRQPITRPEVDEIRGVDSGPVLKGLLDRDLIKILGKKDEAGRPMLYGTTDAFLELFSMESLRELPTLKEFTELSEESRQVFEREIGEEAPEGAPLEGTEGSPEAAAPDEFSRGMSDVQELAATHERVEEEAASEEEAPDEAAPEEVAEGDEVAAEASEAAPDDEPSSQRETLPEMPAAPESAPPPGADEVADESWFSTDTNGRGS